jgi:hypothetical protein
MTPVVAPTAAVAVAMAAVAAIACVAAAIAIAVAGAATTVAGDRFVVTTQQGDANYREKNRGTQNQCTIHPRILPKKRTGTVP